MNSLSPEAPGPGFIGQVLDDDGATIFKFIPVKIAYSATL